MVKQLISIVITLLLTGCMHDKHYYYNDPKSLQEALKQCPTKPPSTAVSCDDLQTIAQTMNRFAYELQMNPQRFGQKIIDLQTQLAKTPQLAHYPNTIELQKSVASLKNELMIRLAVVKWLESPEGR